MEFEDGCFVVFGKETKGLPESLLAENKETCMRIPMVKLEKARSLNLSNSVAIVVYDGLKANWLSKYEIIYKNLLI